MCIVGNFYLINYCLSSISKFCGLRDPKGPQGPPMGPNKKWNFFISKSMHCGQLSFYKHLFIRYFLIFWAEGDPEGPQGPPVGHN